MRGSVTSECHRSGDFDSIWTIEAALRHEDQGLLGSTALGFLNPASRHPTVLSTLR